MLTQVPLFNQRIVKIQRRQAGAYLDHEYKEGGIVESDLKGSVQPATPKDLRNNPQGEDITEGIKIYTADTKGVRTTDIIKDGENSYRVVSVTPWNYHGYYKIVAGLIND